MEENLGAFEEKRNEAAETAESAGKGGKHLTKGGKRGWAIAGIALGVLAAAYLGLCAYATLSGTIYPNTTVGGVDYGGMTEEQAAAELTRRVIDAQSARLDFAVMEGDSCEVIAGVALGDIPADIDCRKAADTLARVCSAKGGGFFKSGAGFLFSLFTEHEESIVSEEPFCAAAEPVLDALECEPVEFAIALTTESAISVTKSRDGRHIPDREQARRDRRRAARRIPWRRLPASGDAVRRSGRGGELRDRTRAGGRSGGGAGKARGREGQRELRHRK